MSTENKEIMSAEGTAKLSKNLIIKVMKVFWNIAAKSDEKTHKSQTPPSDVVKIKDVQYAGSDKWHALNVYYPEETVEKLPVIIDIHGGGWMYGTKDMYENYCLSLAERGYVVFDINYRLVPDVMVQQQLSDVMLALKWIFENLSSYPCQESNIILTGDSAGGQLAAYAAVLLQSRSLCETFGVCYLDKKLTALLLTSPVAYMKKSGWMEAYTKILWGLDYKKKSTYKYMDFDEIIDFASYFPPTYLVTSSGDTLAHGQTHRAYELLKSRGIKCEIADYPAYNGKKLPHVFNVLKPFDEIGSSSINKSLDFCKSFMN